MRGLLGRINRKAKRVIRSLAEWGVDERILKHEEKLESLAHKSVSVSSLGRGKDGETLLVEDQKGDKQIVKILSTYATNYLPVLEEVLEYDLPDEFEAEVQIRDGEFLTYPYEPLTEIKTTAEAFTSTLIQVVEMQKKLLEKDLLYWDLGFSTHSNYMTKPDGKIKIIDYGGNAFLFLSRDVKISLSSRRRNLVYAGESFVKAAFLLHLLNIGMGQKATMSWASDIQHVNEKELSLVIDRVYKLLEGSLYSEVAKAVIKHNLISTTGWEKLSEALQAVSKEKIHVFEGADITETTFSGNSVEVRGYQNFLVTREGITIKNSSEKLWETEVKQKVVEKAFSQIETEVDSFLDIGCNSGLYSFLAREKFGARVLGVDYNKDYIDLCSRIVIHLGLEAISFATGVFSDLEEEYDCVLAMGLIHHLYHRTEEYGDLGNIMSKFASISKKFTIIEFPDENDPKASKWTNIAGRKAVESYSKESFLKHCNSFYDEVIKIGETAATRAVYLLKKKNN